MTEAQDRVKARLDTISSLIESGKKTIIIFGDVGVGKTHTAKLLPHDYFIDEPTFKMHLSSGNLRLRGPDEYLSSIELYPLEALSKVPTVVYDDFGSSSITEAYLEKALYWINSRLNRGLVTIITTNLGIENREAYEPRITSRLSQNAAFIEIQGPDLRKAETITLQML